MLKILVVDDEQIVLNAVKFIIEKRQSDVVVCGTATNGREAIEKAKVLRPDIVFMDIRMPGLSGIESIKEIKYNAPDVRFVIISAYEQFEFAKQAVHLGVKDYMLKPINRHKLNEIIDVLVKEILGERRQREKELVNIERLQSMIPYLENSFIYAIMSGSCDVKELQKYFNLLEMECDEGYIMTIELSASEAFSIHDKYLLIRDIIKYKSNALIGPLMYNKVVLFMPQKQTALSYDIRVEAMSTGESIMLDIVRQTGLKSKIGIGSIQMLTDLYYSYGQAQKALLASSEGEILHVEDMYSTPNSFVLLSKQQKTFTDCLQKGESQKALQLFEQMYQLIQGNRERILELIVLIYKVAQDEGLESDAVLRYESYLKECSEIAHESDLKRWIASRIQYIVDQLEIQKKSKCSSIVEKARQTVDAHYPDDLTLEGISRDLNISPQYLSRLFKEEIGQTFIEYLTGVRIKVAKSIMKSSSKSVKEVCFEVGYSDPNYFSRLFKKRTGVMPTEYIRLERK